MIDRREILERHRLGWWRTDAIIFLVRVLLRAMGEKTDFDGLTLYSEGVGSCHLRRPEVDVPQVTISVYFRRSLPE